MIDYALNPNNLAHQLTAQSLYNDFRIMVAEYQDCYLFIFGGDNATVEFMDPGDAFILGDLDLSDAVLDMVMDIGDAGNATGMAGCGTLYGCPVRNLHNTTMPDKDGEFEFRFCVGSWEMGSSELSGAW